MGRFKSYQAKGVWAQPKPARAWGSRTLATTTLPVNDISLGHACPDTENMKVVQPSFLADVSAITNRHTLKRRPSQERKTVMKTLFLGGGLQSSLMVEMVLTGELERPDLVVFNDTKDEPWWVYQQAASLRNRLHEQDIEYTSGHYSCNGIMFDLQSSRSHGSMPVFVKNADGSTGRLRRQCTDYYKVQPGNYAIRMWLLRHGFLHLKPGIEEPMYHSVDDLYWLPSVPRNLAVECWFGYTTDEMVRAQSKSKPKWQLARYPLIEMNMSRVDCEQWYASRGRHIPLKSACIQCPYRNDEAWLWMKREQPATFEDACRYDELLRKSDTIKSKGHAYAKIKGDMYLHKSCISLQDIDFESLTIKKQSSMFEIELIDDCRSDGGFSCMS